MTLNSTLEATVSPALSPRKTGTEMKSKVIDDTPQAMAVSTGGGPTVHRMDENLKTLIEAGQQQGFLTFTQVNEYLPDEAVNPEKLDQLLDRKSVV